MFERLFGGTSKKDTTNLEEVKKKLEEVKEAEKILKEEERKKNLVKLSCEGTYRFDVKENSESFKEWCRRTDHGYHNGAYTYTSYHSHLLTIVYNVIVTYNDLVYTLSNDFTYLEVSSEDNAYDIIVKTLKDDVHMEKMKERLKEDIVAQLEEHLRTKNIEKVKKLLDQNKAFDIDFTIETLKTKNM